jgi:hypothetical protein
MLSRNVKSIQGLLAVLLLAACQPVPVSTPIPTPVVWEIQYTSALSWLGPVFSDCISEQPHASIIVFETPPQALDPTEVDFAFRWGSPLEVQGYAAVIGWDDLAVIVHPSSPVETIPHANVIDIYAGTIRLWSQVSSANTTDVGRIRLWGYPAGNDVMDVFDAFTGGPIQGDAIVYLAPDPQAMIEAIAEDPSAIGFIPHRWLDSRVRAVSISDLDGEILRQPILALSAAEPQGDRRAWLLCVQEQLSAN